MTDNGKRALDLICKYYKVNGESFSAADLTEISGIKISGNSLSPIAKEGYLKKVGTNPATYVLVATNEHDAFNNVEGLYRSLNETINWPNFEDYSYRPYMVHAGQMIPDTVNEKLVWKPDADFQDGYTGLFYAFVVNGKFYKGGKTDNTMKDRIPSYNSGKSEYRKKNGTCSVTNYFVLQTLLNFNVPVDVYCYYVPKAKLEIFGEVVEISVSPSKYVEGIFLNQANKEFGAKLPGCFQD